MTDQCKKPQQHRPGVPLRSRSSGIIGHDQRNTHTKPLPGSGRGFVLDGAPGGDLLSRGQSALSSAQSRFTVLFGMGRRGSNSLWPPSKLVGGRRLSSTPRMRWACCFNNVEEVRLGLDRQQQALSPLSSGIRVQGVAVTPHPSRLTPHTTQGYRIKSHGQLVSVSLTHCCASTPDLSTRWSTATL